MESELVVTIVLTQNASREYSLWWLERIVGHHHRDGQLSGPFQLFPRRLVFFENAQSIP